MTTAQADMIPTNNVDLTRKELYSLKASQIPAAPAITPDDVFSRYPRDYLDIHTHQLFCRNFFNAETSHKALILEHDCHAAGTKVLTTNRPLSGGMNDPLPVYEVNIEDLRVGDYVFSEAGVSTVIATKTGTDDMYQLSYTIGDMPTIHVACNASHLITTTRGDVPIVDFVDVATPDCQLVMCRTPSLRASFAAAFTIEYAAWDREVMPGSFLQTLAALCGIKFVRKTDDTWTIATITIPFVPFTVTSLQRGTYYGITLASPTDRKDPHRPTERPSSTDRETSRYILPGGILTHNTGTGKTITACNIIATYIDAYRKTYDNLARKTTLYGLEKMAYLDEATPCVLIVGFEGTQDAFFRELTNYVAYGFVTPQERDQLQRMRSIVDRSEATADDHRRLKEFTSRLRRRLSDKSAGGFVDFKGFQELVNFIFEVKNKDISLDYIEKESISRDVPASVIFDELIATGALRPRTENIRKYDRSLIVVDELHNTYNSRGKNSRGIVLEYLIRETRDSRFLGLTATLLNASPAEMVDVLGYIEAAKNEPLSTGDTLTASQGNTLTASQGNEVTAAQKRSLRREDYFITVNGRDAFISPDVPEKLGRMSEGYFSYLRDSDPRYYPRVNFMGDELILTGRPSPGVIKYQRFWKVPMSRELQLAHDKVITEHGMDDGRVRVPIQSEIIFDITFPIPGNDPSDQRDDRQVDYLTSADQVSRILQTAPKEFLDAHGIAIHRDADGLYVTGPILMTKESRDFMATMKKKDVTSSTKKSSERQDNPSGRQDNNFHGLEVYSPKYTRFLSLLSETKGKCMAFHKRVRGSGVILIAEILKLNGYVHDDAEPTMASICSQCSSRLRDHGREAHKDHAFTAARFLMAYGQNKSEMPRILQKFNSPLNTDGSRYKLLVGSKVIRESYDFKAITDIFMLDEPNNISMTLQVYGRAVRKNSHAALPIDERVVNIHTLVYTVNPAYPSLSPDAAQAQRYKLHMDDYVLIQEVDRARRKYAIDAAINAATIWGHRRGDRQGDSRGNLAERQSDSLDKPTLGPLPFTPVNDVPDGLTLDELQTASFRSRRYFRYEMDMIGVIIKRLFMSKHVFTYADLVKSIRSPPFTVQVNTALIDEALIRIVLAMMVNSPKLAGTLPSATPSLLMASLTNPVERRVILEDRVYRIAHVGDDSPTRRDDDTDVTSGLYILAPCTPDGDVIVDALIDQQPPPTTTRRIVSVDRLISESHNVRRYATLRESMILETADGTEMEDFARFLLSYPVAHQQLLIEDCIRWDVFGVTTKNAPGDIPRQKIRGCIDLVLSGMHALGATVTYHEIKLYKQADKYLPSGTSSSGKKNGGAIPTSERVIPDDAIVGYETIESIRILTTDGTFADVSKTIFNRTPDFRDMPPVIAFIEDVPGDKPRYKIRGADEVIGIVCRTKPKEQLASLLREIGIPTQDGKTRTYCHDLLMHLIDAEAAEREEMTKNKYFYGWWTAPMPKQ